MKLSEELKTLRADRPDEWTMDRLVRKAELLEMAIAYPNNIIKALTAEDETDA